MNREISFDWMRFWNITFFKKAFLWCIRWLFIVQSIVLSLLVQKCFCHLAVLCSSFGLLFHPRCLQRRTRRDQVPDRSLQLNCWDGWKEHFWLWGDGGNGIHRQPTDFGRRCNRTGVAGDCDWGSHSSPDWPEEGRHHFGSSLGIRYWKKSILRLVFEKDQSIEYWSNMPPHVPKGTSILVLVRIDPKYWSILGTFQTPQIASVEFLCLPNSTDCICGVSVEFGNLPNSTDCICGVSAEFLWSLGTFQASRDIDPDWSPILIEIG